MYGRTVPDTITLFLGSLRTQLKIDICQFDFVGVVDKCFRFSIFLKFQLNFFSLAEKNGNSIWYTSLFRFRHDCVFCFNFGFFVSLNKNLNK